MYSSCSNEGKGSPQQKPEKKENIGIISGGVRESPILACCNRRKYLYIRQSRYHYLHHHYAYLDGNIIQMHFLNYPTKIYCIHCIVHEIILTLYYVLLYYVYAHHKKIILCKAFCSITNVILRFFLLGVVVGKPFFRL